MIANQGLVVAVLARFARNGDGRAGRPPGNTLSNIGMDGKASLRGFKCLQHVIIGIVGVLPAGAGRTKLSNLLDVRSPDRSTTRLMELSGTTTVRRWQLLAFGLSAEGNRRLAG